MKRRNAYTLISLLLTVSLLLTGCAASSAEEVNNIITDETTTTTVSAETQEPETNTTETTKVSNTTSESDTDSTTTTTTTTAAETTVATTTTEKAVTTPVTESEPVPEWTENAINKTTMYVNTNGIYSRKKALQGSTAVKQYALNTAVTVVALTDTDYYKLTDGTYIHKDYLSLGKVTVTTTTTIKPVTTTTTTTVATEPEFVFTEEMRLEYEKEAARLINEFRVENGLKALEWNEIMHQATRIRAEEETIQIGHERPNGETYSDLLVELGYWDSLDEFWELENQGLVCSPGECLCWGGAYTPEEAVQSWIDSKPHRENLLEKEPRFSKMAVGLFYYEEWDSFYWVYWYMF